MRFIACLVTTDRSLSVGYPKIFINNSSWYFIRFYEFQWIHLSLVQFPNRGRILFTHFSSYTYTEKNTQYTIESKRRTGIMLNSFYSKFFVSAAYISVASMYINYSSFWTPALVARYLCTLNYCNWLLYYADQFKFWFWLKTIICVRDHKFDGFVHWTVVWNDAFVSPFNIQWNEPISERANGINEKCSDHLKCIVVNKSWCIRLPACHKCDW